MSCRLVILALITALAGFSAAAEQPLTVVSWGGATGRAIQRALLVPFSASSGVSVAMDDYNGGLAEIRSQVETGNVVWDVVDLDSSDAIRGCDEGLLEVLPRATLFHGEDPLVASEDFLPGTLSDCGLGLMAFSTIFAFRTDHFTGVQPSSISDFFDLARFPGRRGLRRSPYANLEFALVADGVPVDRVYQTLSSPGGIDRAFRKLDSIKDHVVWWHASAQAPQLLADREVVMTTAYNGRIFNAQVIENQPFQIVWDAQILDHAQFAIIVGAPNLRQALDFLAFAAKPESMVQISRHISYSPVRRSALPLVSSHLDSGIPMAPHLPVSAERLHRSVFSSREWWAASGDQVSDRFSAWLAR